MATSNNSSSGGGGPLSAEAAAALSEGVGLVFGRWTALQLVVENQCSGPNARAKADQLGASILSWLCHSKGPHDVEDLIGMIYDTISESFEADFEDGSIEEVATKLLTMHEECQQNNYSSVEKLRNSRVQGNAVSQSRQAVVDDNDNSSSDDNDASMMDDEATDGMAVDKPKASKPVADADRWTVVPPRRQGSKISGKTRKSGEIRRNRAGLNLVKLYRPYQTPGGFRKNRQSRIVETC